jgi:hypothetical protein
MQCIRMNQISETGKRLYGIFGTFSTRGGMNIYMAAFALYKPIGAFLTIFFHYRIEHAFNLKSYPIMLSQPCVLVLMAT